MDPAKLTKNESEANRVLEYYKKYSLNPDLNKYFTGPESFVKKRASDLKASDHDKAPEYVASKSNVELHNINESSCVIEPSSCNSEENTQSAPSLDIEINQVVEIDEVEEKNNSRSSSAASNKIEWDNGADIGYSNSYKLSTKKSASFPSLFTSNVSVKCNVLPTVSQEKSITDNKEELRKMYHQLTFSSDTSNSSNKGYQMYLDSKEPSVESTSSLQENKNLKSSTQSSSSNNSVHRKIGNPVAYSTPHDGSSSSGSIPREKTTSKSSDKYGGYTVTPMLTVPINKRKLNNNKPSELPKEQVVKECDYMGYKNHSPKKKAVPKMDQYQKKINLCLTKPISVECISVESKPIEHKDVQTSFSSDKSSKCVQTEELELEDIVFKPVPICSPLAQKIEYVRFHSDSDKSEARSDKKSISERFVPTKDSPVVHIENLVKSKDNSLERNSKTTQTDLVSREKRLRSQKKIIESEENEKKSRTRMKTKNVDSSEVSSSVNSSRYTSDDRISTNGNVASTECGYKTADAVDEFQTEELLLTEMISLNHSKDLNTDIKRSIDILQKLLKSRKYDQATKKHYIKKIVQKIVDSKYSDDITNSDLFRPKKSSTEHRFVQKSENIVPNTKGTSELMENKPWYPVAEPVYTMPKAKSKKPKSEKTAVEKKYEVPLEQNNNFTYSNVIRNRTFRLPTQKENLEIPEATHTPTPTTSKKNDDQQPRNEKENLIEESPRFTSNSSSRLAYSTSLDKENRPTSSDGKNSSANWRTSKTLSEKILENRDSVDFRKGQGDYLLNVVKNERHHQLSWINNEIEHLVKLKQLLEKKPKDLRPESQLKDVISSLLKMKVDDMKGLPKNFEVLICKSEKTRKRCEPDCGRMKEFQRSRKKSASLTPDYYTIETKLDPDGNLVDLTVFDGNGKRKYNYRSDGVVDDVSISSKNHNTEVKLKPKVNDTSRQLTTTPHNVCRSCGRLFIQPASDTDVSLCEECFEDISNKKPKTLKDPSHYKICENCGMPFVPAKDNPNLCLCVKCANEETQPEISSLSYSRTEECEACGRLFVRLDDNNSELCLCKDCERQFSEKDKSRRQSTQVCKVCGDDFQTPEEYKEQDICEECLRLIENAEMKCACQKVTFSDPLELGVCRCVTKDSPLDKKEKEWKLKNVPTRIIRANSSGIVKDISESGSKFFPKKPKLVGNDVDELDVSKGYPCTHCISSRESSSNKRRVSKYSVSNDIKQKTQSKTGSPHTSRSKGSNFGVDNSSKPRSKRNSSGSSISSRESPRPKVIQTNQTKKDKCCKACLKCVGFSSTTSPRPGIIRKRSTSIPKKTSSSSPRNSTAKNTALQKKEDSLEPLQLKKSCQCCTCVSCGIQTKKLGDKNVRCQCCVCTNCGIQVTLDANGTQQKTVKSKWCQQKRSETQSNKNFSTDKLEHNRKDLSKKKNVVNRKRDELDHTDESLHSISSGNIVCITPTKYKNISNGKSDSECQCVILNNKTVSESDQHKPLQIRPSVLKFLCKSVNTYNTQERTAYICPTKSPQGASDESRSCESLDYPCKPLKPKMADLRQNSSESSLTCPSKKPICPAKPPPCPGAGNKPCPAYPAKPCRKMKEQTGDESVVSPGRKSSETYFNCPSKNAPCPAKPPPCPGSGNKPCPAFPAKPCPSLSKKNRDLDADNVKSRESSRSRKICTNQNGEDFRYEKKEKRKSSRESDRILLPVSIKPTSPLQEVQNTGYETNQSKNSRNEPQTQDQSPSITPKSPPNPPPFNDNHQDLQVFMCTTETRTNNKKMSEQKCSCSLDMCKCNQTTTHEEKDVQCPASKQCQCQTEPKEDANVQCDCKALPERSSNKDKAKQNEENLCICKKSSSSSSSSSDSQSDTESYMSCICCKKEKILKNLIKKIPLCEPCQEVNQKNFYPHSYSNPLHSCMCYKLVDCDILYQFKQTLTEIERLDIYQQYCEVLKNCKCCKECGCKCKLPKRFKNGCAYFLKLEDACPNTHCDEDESSDSSDYDEDEDDGGNDLPEVTVKVPNCRGSCARKKENGQARETKKYRSCPSIQNYLCTMKPDFVERAERRRRILKDATSQREENSDKRKLKFIDRINYLNQKKRSERFSSEADIVKPGGYQTKAYCVFDIELNESPKRVRPRVFKSFKEMKDLTRRKYLHLNEVKSKKDIHREKRLREANRLLANTFTRRLQKSTLRGAVDIPLNVKVVSY